MREFMTAAEKSELAEEEEAPPITFLLDGEKVTAYQPGDGQFGMFMASTSKHESEHEQVAGIINFFLGLLDDDGKQYVTSKLLDRNDPFGVLQVQEIMEYLAEEWAARPTSPPSGSTPSPPTTGSTSTPPTPALI